MKISLYCIGKTNSKELNQLMNELIVRIPKHLKFQIVEISDVKNAKNLSSASLKQEEGVLFLNKIEATDFLILLDENGKHFNSIEFSENLQQKMNQSFKHLVFCIGGAFGFSKEMHERANEKISFSKMTFTHQMIRLFFVEQLYRAFSIIEGKPYHNE